MVLLVGFITTATTLKKTYRGKALILAPGFRDHSPRLVESNDWSLRYGRLSQWGGCVAEGAAHIKVARKRRKQRAGVRNNHPEVCPLWYASWNQSPHLTRTVPQQFHHIMNQSRVWSTEWLCQSPPDSITASKMASNQVPHMDSLWGIIPVQTTAKE